MRPASSEHSSDISLTLTSRSAQATLDIGRALGAMLRGGEVIALAGGLASGKTTLTRGLAAGLGCPHAARVNSPTYVLEQVYDGKPALCHLDAYRLSSPDELRAVGFDERLRGDHVVVVEWADRVECLLPGERLRVLLGFVDGEPENVRCLAFSGAALQWGDVLGRMASYSIS